MSPRQAGGMCVIRLWEGAQERLHGSWWPAGLPEGPSVATVAQTGSGDGGTCCDAGVRGGALGALEVVYESPRGTLPAPKRRGRRLNQKAHRVHACLVKVIWASGCPLEGGNSSVHGRHLTGPKGSREAPTGCPGFLCCPLPLL